MQTAKVQEHTVTTEIAIHSLHFIYKIFTTGLALDATCTSGGTTDQCTDAIAECKNVGSELKCLCKSTHYKSGTVCNARKFDNKLCILYLKITLINVIQANSYHRNCVHSKIYKMYRI